MRWIVECSMDQSNADCQDQIKSVLSVWNTIVLICHPEPSEQAAQQHDWLFCFRCGCSLVLLLDGGGTPSLAMQASPIDLY